jgi:hypothetical protein
MRANAVVSILSCACLFVAPACSSSSASHSPPAEAGGGCSVGQTFVGSNGLCCECVGGAETYRCGGGIKCDAPMWWPSCGDSPCTGFKPIAGVALCTGEQGAGYCTTAGAKCQFESNDCNLVATCSLVNPYVCADSGVHD